MERIIQESITQLQINDLKIAAVRSLRQFAVRQYNTMVREFGIPSVFLLLMATLANDEEEPIKRLQAQNELNKRFEFELPVGVPLQTFAKTYIEQTVTPVLDELAKVNALDPDDVSGRNSLRNSLRNRTEMEVRYNDHLNSIEELKASGHKLVICSVHSDCSERCSHWQGRIYSLDGTYGTTSDGKSYIPLEVATDVYYTTRVGRVYKNGLLGFNCFDKETEVLTNNGWKLFKDLSTNDYIYTLNTTTRNSEWQKPINYYKEHYKGNMVYLHNTTSNLCVTPNHNLLYYTQKSKELRFKEAQDWTLGTLQYAGQKWNGKHVETIQVGNVEVDAKLYCKLLAYYLADGSIHNATAIKIAQQNNEWMFNELKALPFKVWHDKNKIVVFSKALHDSFIKFGRCDKKYIPSEIKELSKDLLNTFIEAYLKTDGYISKQKEINGYMRKPHKQVFTTSLQLMADLCEIALKCGYRPSINVHNDKGKENQFKNGCYKSNFNVYCIHLNYTTGINKVNKDYVEYDDYVYCVEVPNHTLLVKRNGKIQWCGNCRHYLIPYQPGYKLPVVNPKVEMQQRLITQKQRQLERNVRAWKTRAIELKDINREEYLKARRKAIEWNKRYIAYSREHNRAYYPSRTKII